jgi:hypothetical protein
MERQWAKMLAVILGGSIADTIVAATLLGFVQIVGSDNLLLAMLGNSGVQGLIMIIMGQVFLNMMKDVPGPKEEWSSRGVLGAFLLAFTAPFVDAQNPVIMAYVMQQLGIAAESHHMVLVAFCVGAFAAWCAGILVLSYWGERGGRHVIFRLMQLAFIACIGWGYVQLYRGTCLPCAMTWIVRVYDVLV